MEQQIGKEETDQLVSAISSSSPTSLRINSSKTCTETSDSVLAEDWEPVLWCNEGRYLKERPSFTFDPLLHAGAYYVQEASSMYLHQIIKNNINTPVVALDLCAAPGGKSTLALSALPQGSLLIANEVMKQRCNILAENITKWGNSNCIVTNNYAEDFAPMGQIFDLIICDAPCSGEGMFRKDEKAIEDWSLNNVDICWKRQREIIENIWNNLKPGGIFIYSTCTYNHYEDEDNIKWIIETLGAEPLPLQDSKDWNIVNGHFFPHRTKGEGFYVCPLKKILVSNYEDETMSHPQKKHYKKSNSNNNIKPIKNNSQEYKILQSYISNADNFVIYENKGDFSAFPKEYMNILQDAQNCLKVIHSGIKLASLKGKNLQPEHSLAMSTALDTKAFEIVELTKEEAIAYLRTEAITVEAPKGYILLTYKNIPLGFGKNIGNRVNNLYPSEWRIRKNH